MNEDIEQLETLNLIEVPHLFYSVYYRLSGNCVNFYMVFLVPLMVLGKILTGYACEFAYINVSSPSSSRPSGYYHILAI